MQQNPVDVSLFPGSQPGGPSSQDNRPMAPPAPRPVSLSEAMQMASGVGSGSKRARPTFRYEVPASIRNEVVRDGYFAVHSITVTLLRDMDEAAAAERATATARLPTELARGCLFAVNDHAVSLGDGSADTAWEALHPKVKNLVQRAYMKNHYPDDEAVDSFLASVQQSTA